MRGGAFVYTKEGARVPSCVCIKKGTRVPSIKGRRFGVYSMTKTGGGGKYLLQGKSGKLIKQLFIVVKTFHPKEGA